MRWHPSGTGNGEPEINGPITITVIVNGTHKVNAVGETLVKVTELIARELGIGPDDIMLSANFGDN